MGLFYQSFLRPILKLGCYTVCHFAEFKYAKCHCTSGLHEVFPSSTLGVLSKDSLGQKCLAAEKTVTYSSKVKHYIAQNAEPLAIVVIFKITKYMVHIFDS